MKNKMKNIFIALIVIPNFLFANDTLEIINKIKKRYYAITSEINKLQVIKIDSAIFYLSNGKIEIAKSIEKDGVYEYYYDIENVKSSFQYKKYFPYFVYFNSKDKSISSDIRAYYSDENFLVRYMKGDSFEVLSFNDMPDGLLRCKNNHLFNIFNNLFYQSIDFYDNEIANIDNKVLKINQKNLVKKYEDTSPEPAVAENSISSYYDGKGKLLKLMNLESDGNIENRKYTYFDEGEEIFSISSNYGYTFSWGGATSVKISYLKKGNLIKTIEYSNFGCGEELILNKDNNLIVSKKIIPQIMIYNYNNSW